MRKEVLLAIIIGVIVGLGITFGLYLLRERLRPSQTLQDLVNRNDSPSPTPTAEGMLTIQQPKPDQFVRDSTLRVVGKAWPNSYIVILAEGREYVTNADADGDFSQEVELVAGGNRITVVATSTEGQQEEKVLSIVFSTVDLDSQSATPSGGAQ